MRKLVALSASYGAGGNVIGPALAERLGVPFLDRAIPVKVAERLEVQAEEVDAVEDDHPGLVGRVLAGFTAGETIAPTWLPGAGLNSEDFRRETEKVLLAQCETGQGVMLGRAGTIVLRDDPKVLRVRLDGPREARIRQAMGFGEIDEETARRTAERLDRTHADYARELYGADIRDPALYDLMIDATRLSVETCVELLYTAASADPPAA